MLHRKSGTDADYGPLELYGQLVVTPSMQTAPVECPAGWIPCSEMPPGATGIVNATYHDCCQVVGGGMETADCVNIARWPITSSVPNLDEVAPACSNDMPFRCRFRSAYYVMDRCCSSPSVVPPTGYVLERCVRKPPVIPPVIPPPAAGPPIIICHPARTSRAATIVATPISIGCLTNETM